MADRIIRDELLESERWLSLKDNADRLAYFSLLLRADSLGNFSAEPFRLLRLWRDFGITTTALVSKTLSELADHDLVRLYSDGEKTLLHIPRFGQRNTRYIKRTFKISPWTTNEQKQCIAKYSQCAHDAPTVCSQAEIIKEKKRELPSARPPKPEPNPLNIKTWESYSAAYFARYRAPPVRNAKVNGNIAQLVKRLGDESPEVAAFFVTHNDKFYVMKRHPVSLLLSDAEGLRTQWKTGKRATGLEARSAERIDSAAEQLRRLKESNDV